MQKVQSSKRPKAGEGYFQELRSRSSLGSVDRITVIGGMGLGYIFPQKLQVGVSPGDLSPGVLLGGFKSLKTIYFVKITLWVNERYIIMVLHYFHEILGVP